MDTLQLECFIAVAKNRNYTEAAFELAMSQSSVSKHMMKLEKELQTRLFERHTRKVSLTVQGESFLEHALNIMAEYHLAMQKINCHNENHTLRVGSVDHLRKVGLTKPIANFLESFPSIHIALEQSDTRHLVDLLLQCKIDLALIAHIYCDSPHLSNIEKYDLQAYSLYTIVQDNYDLAVNINHPLAASDQIVWSQLNGEKLLILDASFSSNAIIKNMLQVQHVHCDIAFEGKQVDTIIGLLNENFGVSLLSKRVIQDHPSIKSIAIENPICRDTVLVAPKVSLQTEFCQKFIAQMIGFADDTP
jgi:DNA-binding transcriptional LysR family regulator